MNLNDEMRDLGSIGSLAYAPTEELISSLVAKTRRVRTVRQGSATIVGTVGAIAIGIMAAQAYSAAKDDPAFRDRNVINNKDGLTPIELYRAKFGNDNPTRSYDSAVDLSSIVAKLKAAAAGGSSHPNPGTQQAPVKPVAPPVSTAPVKTTTPAAPSTSAPPDPFVQCKADHPDMGYKYYDCSKGKWITRSGWYKDPATQQYFQCSSQPAYVGYTYNCSTGSYAPKEGYFLFGNGAVYQAVTWVDAATGVSSLGNWSGTGNWGGWDQKAIQLNPSTKAWDGSYVYMGNNATWSGTTCTGKTITKYGASVKASCLPKSQVQSLGVQYVDKDGLAWVLDNQSLRWHPNLNIYADPAAPPAGWTWDGDCWVAVTPSP